MKFWKENKMSGEFDMPAKEVARQFIAWMMEQPGMTRQELREHSDLLAMGLERLLRWWLTSHEHFNSVWEAESSTQFGDESFYGIYDLIWDQVYGIHGHG